MSLRHVLELSRRSLGGAELPLSIAAHLGNSQENVGPLILKPSLSEPLIAGRHHIDKLQQIHAAYNLYDTLSMAAFPSGLSHSAAVNETSPEGASNSSPAASLEGKQHSYNAEATDHKDACFSSSSSSSSKEHGYEIQRQPPQDNASGALGRAGGEATASSSSPAADSVSAEAAKAAAAAWDLFQRLRCEYASKAVGELTRARETFRLRFRETEKHRTGKTLSCAGEKEAPKRAGGAPHKRMQSRAATVEDPGGGPDTSTAATDTKGPAVSSASKAEGSVGPAATPEGSSRPSPAVGEPPLSQGSVKGVVSVSEKASESDCAGESALKEYLEAEKWRRRMGGGRWFMSFATLDDERSRAVALR